MATEELEPVTPHAMVYLVSGIKRQRRWLLDLVVRAEEADAPASVVCLLRSAVQDLDESAAALLHQMDLYA